MKIIFLFLTSITFLFAHSIGHKVAFGGVNVKFYYSESEPLSFCEYEIYSPASKTVFAKGRSDINGVVSFVPDTKGIWKVKIIGESDHGFHGKEIEIDIADNLQIVNFSQSPYEKYQKLIVGIAILFSIMSIIGMYRCKRFKQNNPQNMESA